MTYRRLDHLENKATYLNSAAALKREITKYINRQQSTKGTRGKPNEQPPHRQAAIQLPKYVTHTKGEPKYKYGQQEQATVRNHNRSTPPPPPERPICFCDIMNFLLWALIGVEFVI